MAKCDKCNDTGVIDTGNNDLPCDCPAGDAVLFNTAGVEGPVTCAEMRRHFFNGSAAAESGVNIFVLLDPIDLDIEVCFSLEAATETAIRLNRERPGHPSFRLWKHDKDGLHFIGCLRRPFGSDFDPKKCWMPE